MSAVDVQDVGEAVLQHPSDGVVVGQIVMLLKVSVLVEVDGREVGGEHVQVDGLAVVLRRRGDVLLQTVQQQGALRSASGASLGDKKVKDVLVKVKVEKKNTHTHTLQHKTNEQKYFRFLIFRLSHIKTLSHYPGSCNQV